MADTVAAGPFVIDLDKERATRREGRGDNLEVANKGARWLLPVELPVEAVEPLAELGKLADLPVDGDDADSAALEQLRHALEAGLVALFCDEADPPRDADDRIVVGPTAHPEGCGWRRWKRSRPSMDDELALWAGLFAAYGTSLGEALASLESAASDGAPSDPTSGGTTAPTRATSGAASRRAAPNRASKRAVARKASTAAARKSRR